MFYVCPSLCVCQREEEERKEEERRRAAEERRRLEKERVLKERRDAEERDRKMNEKLQMIEEQRWEQCLCAVNSAPQWVFLFYRTKFWRMQCDLDDNDFWIAIISGAVVFVCFFVSQKKTGRARRRAAQKGKN